MTEALELIYVGRARTHCRTVAQEPAQCEAGISGPLQKTISRMTIPTRFLEGPGTLRSVLECARVALRRDRAVLSACVALLAALVPEAALSQTAGTVSGRVVDERTEQPVSEAVVRIAGIEVEALTDGAGLFSLSMIPVGEQLILFEHLAYGEHSRRVLVEPDGHLQFEVRISQQAIELAPLVVESRTDLERRRQSTGFSMNEVEAEEIDQAARIGQTLSELLRDRLPGAFIRGSCLETRGPTGGSRCREVRIILDGIPISAPGTLLATMPISNIERLELLSAGEAGARYGSLGGNGVLLIETKTGRRPDQRLAAESRVTGFDWSGESEPYPWTKVFGSALLANAVGLGVGYALSKDCFRFTEESLFGLRTQCDGFKTTAAGFISLGLPSVAGSYAARWAGSTARSQGRILPMAVGGTLTSLAGYLLVIAGDPAGEIVGAVILGVTVPALMALSDRVFRTLR